MKYYFVKKEFRHEAEEEESTFEIERLRRYVDALHEVSESLDRAREEVQLRREERELARRNALLRYEEPEEEDEGPFELSYDDRIRLAEEEMERLAFAFLDDEE